MAPVMVEIATRPPEAEEIEFVEDMDPIAASEVMLGCGDDNPY